MPARWQATGTFERRAAERADVVRYVGEGGLELRLEGVSGVELPSVADSLSVAELADEGPAPIRLRVGAAEFQLVPRSWRVHEAQPQFFQSALAGFGPSAGEARALKWLLRLLRLPGGARLLSRWHARRSR